MTFESYSHLQAAKLLTYFSLAFIVGMWLAPVVIHYLRKFRFWKKTNRSQDSSGRALEVTKKFYQEDESTKKVPRAGGMLIWITVLLIAGFFFVFLKLFPDNSDDVSLFEFLNFTDWTQTYIPLGVMISSAMLGLVDDFLSVRPAGGNYFAGGLRLSHRALGVVAISGFIGWWFHTKIGDKMHEITVPIWSNKEQSWTKIDLTQINLPLGWLDQLLANIGLDWTLSSGGWLIVPITMIVLYALWGSSIIDGYDGIAAGTLIPIYLAFSGIAFVVQAYDIATFMAVVTGALTAYLWFNIPPAKFYMGETGALSLLLTLGVVAMLLDKLYVLPIAGFLLLLTVSSAFIQVFSKKFFGEKVFLAAPLHHHLEASGWDRNQVTMRYWLISIICSVLGFAFGLIVQ